MTKKILLTGATDGIGYETAKKLISMGHHVLIHGRSADKLKRVEKELSALGKVESFRADFSNLKEVESFANEILSKHSSIDILINNAGVFKMSDPVGQGGLDSRFIVNTITPYYLSKKLLPILNSQGRIINLSSAAQATVQLNALFGKENLSEFDAYAQSKLALTMFSFEMANKLPSGPIIIAVNPGSLLASKMVKEGFGTEGKDIQIGVNILADLALDAKYSHDSGKYFDNDLESFSAPHNDCLDENLRVEVVSALDQILKETFNL
jgi:NAD(P)-dependent dehydrogenase (short-subunit alcohol dehydrogenase family)